MIKNSPNRTDPTDMVELLKSRNISPIRSSNIASMIGFSLNFYEKSLNEVLQPPLTENILVYLQNQHRYRCRADGEPARIDSIAPGNFVILSAHRFAHWEFESGVQQNIHLHFSPSLLESIAAREAGGSVGAIELIGYRPVEDPQMAPLTALLKAEAEDGCRNGRLYSESLATALAVYLIKHYGTSPPRIAAYTGGLSARDLEQAIAFIQANLSYDLSLNAIASSVALSPYHFSRLFKQSMGISPHQYVLRERINRAKSLLLNGAMPITEVAVETGFFDAAHLSRQMKRLQGVTPKELRGS